MNVPCFYNGECQILWYGSRFSRTWPSMFFCVFTKNTDYYTEETKIFHYCTCPAGHVTYNFHSSYKHMNLSFNSYTIKNIGE